MNRLGLLLLVGLGCQPGNHVTGESPFDPTWPEPRNQSESVISVSVSGLQTVVTVHYNSETDSVQDGTIELSAGGRLVHRGASEVGWSYSTDGGGTWTYGGTVKPPTGWAAIWSDPAITRVETNHQDVFASYLAIPDSKFPVSGTISGLVNDFLGGACILRSSDSGKHFAIHQCVQATDVDPDGDFYDGGSMAGGPDGSIYASFVDLDMGQIHVWRAANANAAFVRLPPPFRSFEVDINAHPRIRVDQTTGALYVLAPGIEPGGSQELLYIDRWDGSGWSGTRQASTLRADPSPLLSFANGTARRADEYSFDIGTTSGHAGPFDAIRILYGWKNTITGRHHLQPAVCSKDLSGCFYGTSGWSTGLAEGDQFGPVVRFFDGTGSPLGPVWKASWLSRERDPTGSTFDVREGNLAVLGNGTHVLTPIPQTGLLPVCQTLGGYWGDYEDLQFMRVNLDTLLPQFIRTYSDSTAGCFDQWAFASWHLHVSASIFY